MRFLGIRTKKEAVPTKVIRPRLYAGFNVHFPKDDKLVDVVKFVVPGKPRWDPVAQCWAFGEEVLDLHSIELLEANHGFTLTPEAKTRLKEATSRLDDEQKLVDFNDIELNVKLNRELYPFQRVGVAYAVKKKRVYIADSMGLGKSLEAIAAVEAQGAYPCVIACPAAVKHQWEREIRDAVPWRKSFTVYGEKAYDEYPGDFIIVNYDVLHAHAGTIRDIVDVRSVVFDELHCAKTPGRRRSKAALVLAKDVPVRIGLSGTPILNRPDELVNQLVILDRIGDLGGKSKFTDRYCRMQDTDWGLKCVGSQNEDELNFLLQRTCMIRRRKADVLPDLPEKTRNIIPTDLINREEYEKAHNDILEWVRQQCIEGKRPWESLTRAQRAEALVRLGALRRIVGRGKVAAVIEWAQGMVESGERVVIFTQHRDVTMAIAEAFPEDATVMMGGMSAEEKAACVEEFARKRILVATMGAAGTGVDGLQNHASHVAFAEMGWTPGSHMQAEDRLLRIGQRNAVTCHYFLGEKTIDGKVYATVTMKQEGIRAIIDGGEGDSFMDSNVAATILDGLGEE